MPKHLILFFIAGILFLSFNNFAQETLIVNTIDTSSATKEGLNLESGQNKSDSIQNRLIVTIPDSTSKPKKEKTSTQKQLKFSADIGNIAYSFADETRKDYQIAVDYLYKKWYLTAETGIGKGNINYDNLKYNTNSYFIRIGGDNSLLQAISDKDFDIFFFGFRYGLAFGNRSDVYYQVPSPFGPPSEGNLPAKNFVAHWGEMTMGLKVEMWKGVFLGWNFRAKFLLNGKTFENTLTPNYIAGYGKADQTTSFGFNIYLGYAIRWKS